DRAASGQRHTRDADGDGRSRGSERDRGPLGPAGADARMKLPAQPAVPRGRIRAVMRRLARAIDGLEEPAVEKIAGDQKEDPFQVLIATMLSAQTKDAVTHAAATRLFKLARTPRTMLKLRVKQIER